MGIGAVTASITGTYAGVTINFEGSIDNTTWFALAAQPLGSVTPTLVTSVAPGTNASVAWNISPILGINYVRVRASAYTSGTANVTISTSAQFTQYSMNIATVPTTAVTQSTSPWITREGGAGTATITQVTPATTSTALKASNANRKRLVLYNGGTSDCYISYGATASTTAFTFILPSLGTVTIFGEEYTGAVNGIWLATGGASMQVTETT